MNVVKTENKLSFEFDIGGLTNRQRLVADSFAKESDLYTLARYLGSFKGKRTYVRVPRGEVSGFDRLGHKTENTWLNKHQEELRYPSSSWKPSEHIPDGKAIGVEIECFIPAQRTSETNRCDCEGIYDEITDTVGHDDECASFQTSYENRNDIERRVKALLKKHQVKRVSVKDDGSLREPDGYESFEFTCLSNADNMENLRRLCVVLKELGATVNRSCGLHVHLDARDGSGRLLKSRLKTALPFLCKLVPKTRLDNEYCRHDTSSKGVRYAKINTESLRKHKTVEIRMHSGTVDFVKISNWIRVLLAVARGPNKLTPKTAASPMAALARLGLPLDLNAWLLERMAKFYGPALDLNYVMENGNERAA